MNKREIVQATVRDFSRLSYEAQQFVLGYMVARANYYRQHHPGGSAGTEKARIMRAEVSTMQGLNVEKLYKTLAHILADREGCRVSVDVQPIQAARSA